MNITTFVFYVHGGSKTRIDNQTFSSYKIGGKLAGIISIHDSGIVEIEGGGKKLSIQTMMILPTAKLSKMTQVSP